VTLPELEDLPLRQRHLREAGLDDVADDYQPRPWTQPATNGSATPETLSKDERALPAPTCLLDGCDQPATGRLAKYCSTAHQRRASRLRSQARDETVEEAGAAQVVAELGLLGTEAKGLTSGISPNDGLGNAYVPNNSESSVFASMASLAAALPAGWRLELGQGEACLRWSV
jgi:hypothetical protein